MKMSNNNYNGEEGLLFSKSLDVLFKNFDQRKAPLTITVMLRSSTSVNRKELHVRLTNSADLFFLQTLSLTEEDFQCLKNQQGLLVDFGAFPQKFIDLLELCISEQNNSVPKFLLHFSSPNDSNGILDVVETNPFKHLVHLSLQFFQGNDEELKKYLAACLRQEKEEKETFERQLNGTEKDLSGRLSTTQQLLSERTRELDQLRAEWEAKLNETRTKLEEQLDRERNGQVKLQNSYEERLRNERMTFEERYNKSVHELESRLRHAQSANKDLTDQKYKYESLIRELKSKLSTLEEEQKVTAQDVQQLRRQNTNLDSDRHERDKTLNHLRTRIAVLEQELKDKNQVITRTNELLETSSEQKNRLDAEIDSKYGRVKQLEETVHKVSAEVIKGNEIIQKLQSEIKGLKSRVKMMNIVATKQESLIHEKDVVLSQKEKESTDSQLRVNNLQQEVASLKKNVDEYSQKLDENQETLKNNENVINWLNKQLNEQTISKLSSTHNSSNNGRISFTQRTSPLSNNTSSTSNPPRLGAYMQLNNPATAVPQRLNPQMPHRPILKKPQFQADGISPIVTQQLRNPLRPRQISTPVIREESEPLLDPKYLMRKKPDDDISTKDSTPQNNENTDPNLGQVIENTAKSAKPFVISSSYFPEQK